MRTCVHRYHHHVYMCNKDIDSQTIHNDNLVKKSNNATFVLALWDVIAARCQQQVNLNDTYP